MKKVEDIRNREELAEYVARGKKAKYLFFWGHNQSNPGQATKTCFSQWFRSPFEIDGVSYATAEHYMMAEKASLFSESSKANEALIQKIVDATHPQKAKQLGRQVEGFDNDIWNKHRFEIVVKGNVAKFSQNPGLSEFLISTGKRVLVEASPDDNIWGIGLTEDHSDADNPVKWKGTNLLGFALMEARSRLKLELNAAGS